jgi:hypothetical protein
VTPLDARQRPAVRAGMRYVVSLSGGVASAVSAERAIERHGRDMVTLRFADTSWEDADLYRFLDDLMTRWGGDLIRYRDGRTPLQVAEDKSIIPNSNVAPCSSVLKIAPFDRMDEAGPKPVTSLLGLDWREMQRVDRMRARFAPLAAEGRFVDFPLLWKPYEFRPYVEVVKSWGIEPPRLYALGFKHNNCGGRCVKQGIREWLRLRDVFPERFAEVRDWEIAQRAKGGPRADFAIVSDRQGGQRQRVPLATLARRGTPADGAPGQDDLFSCYCGDGEAS